MNEPTLTDTEREALYPVVRKSVGAYMVVERIVAARVAEAVDQERAAWATKVTALCVEAERSSDSYKRHCLVTTGKIRDALLAADDTEAKREAGR